MIREEYICTRYITPVTLYQVYYTYNIDPICIGKCVCLTLFNFFCTKMEFPKINWFFV